MIVKLTTSILLRFFINLGSVGPKNVLFGNRVRFGDNMLWVSYLEQWLDHLMCGLISLVSDNHMDNNLKEILADVYFGLIVNN